MRGIMLKVTHTTMVVVSGLVWLIVGCVLLPLGLNFVVESILKENLVVINRPLLDPLMKWVGGADQAVLFLIAISLWIGFIKGRFVFAKTVQNSVNRILLLPNPVSIKQIYTTKYYLLLGSMIFLGFLMKYTPMDIRGAVDIIIGSALIQGGMLYFRKAFAIRSHKVS
ncbi:hypothetical protein DB44_DE00040 [Candidatus Protochlamydia amoebophila]|uniref:Uncharacterized protein n=2 Tax=Candidatus Protochlamydia amoebophila TaxID=362787 RepID=A0A0C1HA14_9BACT|nr:hypothetical protein DB44_DE00040 [Candidatus Protochlamydia amoebophila]